MMKTLQETIPKREYLFTLGLLITLNSLLLTPPSAYAYQSQAQSQIQSQNQNQSNAQNPTPKNKGEFWVIKKEINSLAPKSLFPDILNAIQIGEDNESMGGINGIPKRKLPEIRAVRVLTPLKNEGEGGLWTEEWQIQRIGYYITYEVSFVKKQGLENPIFAVRMPGKRVGY